MERARSPLFPRVQSKFEGAMYFGLKCIISSWSLFSCVVSGENLRHHDLFKSPGYWKTCFKWEKMEEK